MRCACLHSFFLFSNYYYSLLFFFEGKNDDKYLTNKNMVFNKRKTVSLSLNLLPSLLLYIQRPRYMLWILYSMVLTELCALIFYFNFSFSLHSAFANIYAFSCISMRSFFFVYVAITNAISKTNRQHYSNDKKWNSNLLLLLPYAKFKISWISAVISRLQRKIVFTLHLF